MKLRIITFDVSFKVVYSVDGKHAALNCKQILETNMSLDHFLPVTSSSNTEACTCRNKQSRPSEPGLVSES